MLPHLPLPAVPAKRERMWRIATMTMTTKLWIPHAKMRALIRTQQASLFQNQIIAVESRCLPLAKKMRTSTASNEPEALDADGILADIDVQPIDNPSSLNAGKLDIDQFFGPPIDATGRNGVKKEHRKCKICS
jgi:hypothetical protein